MFNVHCDIAMAHHYIGGLPANTERLASSPPPPKHTNGAIRVARMADWLLGLPSTADDTQLPGYSAGIGHEVVSQLIPDSSRAARVHVGADSPQLAEICSRVLAPGSLPHTALFILMVDFCGVDVWPII